MSSILRVVPSHIYEKLLADGTLETEILRDNLSSKNKHTKVKKSSLKPENLSSKIPPLAASNGNQTGGKIRQNCTLIGFDKKFTLNP